MDTRLQMDDGANDRPHHVLVSSQEEAQGRSRHQRHGVPIGGIRVLLRVDVSQRQRARIQDVPRPGRLYFLDQSHEECGQLDGEHHHERRLESALTQNDSGGPELGKVVVVGHKSACPRIRSPGTACRAWSSHHHEVVGRHIRSDNRRKHDGGARYPHRRAIVDFRYAASMQTMPCTRR